MRLTRSWHTPKGGPNDGGAPLSPSASPRLLETQLSAAAVDATSGLLADVRDEARRVDANTRTIIEGPRDEIQVQLLREQRKIAEANTRARVRERAIVAVVVMFAMWLFACVAGDGGLGAFRRPKLTNFKVRKAFDEADKNGDDEIDADELPLFVEDICGDCVADPKVVEHCKSQHFADGVLRFGNAKAYIECVQR